MKNLVKLLTVITLLFLVGCGGGDEKKEKEKVKIGQKKEVVKKPVKSVTKASETVDLVNKGVGPIKNLDLSAEVDQTMAAAGLELFKTKCTACHKADKKFIGPAPTGLMTRRSPEWIMNMMLNPEEMVSKDPLAKDLLIEFNGSPMANQSLTQEEARSILEYFRTLK